MWRKLVVSVVLASLLTAAALTIAPVPRAHAQSNLESICEPIALFPDVLVSNVLVASTYPSEVEEAAAWCRANPNLSGDALERALESKSWESSVKSLAAFPEVLASLGDNMSWTIALGEAFQNQESEVMATIQNLRFKAQSSGVLVSNADQTVEVEDGAVIIRPTNATTLVAPIYDSHAVFHSPNPVPGLIRFGVRVALKSAFWSGVFDWTKRHIYFGRGYHGWYGGNVRLNNALVNRAYITGLIRGGRARYWRLDPVRARTAAWRGYNRPGVRSGLARPVIGRTTRPSAIRPGAVNPYRPGTIRPGALNPTRPSALPPGAVYPSRPSAIRPGTLNPGRPGGNRPATVYPSRPSATPSVTLPSARPGMTGRPSYPRPGALAPPRPAAGPAARPMPSARPAGFGGSRPGGSMNMDAIRGAQSRGVPPPSRTFARPAGQVNMPGNPIAPRAARPARPGRLR